MDMSLDHELLRTLTMLRSACRALDVPRTQSISPYKEFDEKCDMYIDAESV